MAWLMKNADTLIQTISAISLEPDDIVVSSEHGFETLCSYNWLNNGSAVFVPGGPPRWNPPCLPVTLPPDTGYQFVDQNAFRVPKCPFEPAFRALSVVSPSIQLDGVDIVANRNSLRKLLDFAAGRRQDPFRMDLHMVRGTLFVSRREKSARLMVRGSINPGYGHSFEKIFTKPQTGLSQSSSHHRVVRYKLGRLDCVVRFEVDAYYEDDRTRGPAPATEVHIHDIATSLEGLSINQSREDTLTEGATRVILRGTPVASATLAELKTHKTERINKAMPQLWFGRTPYLITGKHVEGTVHSINCAHIGERFENWEAANQNTLRKLVNLLRELKCIVSMMQGQNAIIVCQKKGAPLTIFSAKEDVAVLPVDITDRHWKNGGDG